MNKSNKPKTKLQTYEEELFNLKKEKEAIKMKIKLLRNLINDFKRT